MADVEIKKSTQKTPPKKGKFLIKSNLKLFEKIVKIIIKIIIIK